MNGFLAVFKREFKGYFSTPLAYVFLVIFLFAAGYKMFSDGFYQMRQAGNYERETAGGRVLETSMVPTPEGNYVTIVTDISERKKAEDALRKQTLIVELLHETAADANEAEDAEAAMRACLEAVCAHTGWPVGQVYVRSPEVPDVLVPTDIWHLDQPERFAAFRKVTQKTTFEPDIGLPGRVLASGKSAWIADVTKDPNFPRAKLAEEIGVRAGFAVPVLVGNRVEAVLEFFAATAVEPDETLLQALGNIGAQVGRAVERKRAEAELAEKEAQLRLALDHMPGGMALGDRDLNYVLFNTRYCELFELPEGPPESAGLFATCCAIRPTAATSAPATRTP